MYDRLLEWCSEHERGNRTDFREAHDWLLRQAPAAAPPPDAAITARSFEALGHIEVSWRDGSWAITPSVVSVVDSSGGQAVLTGSRPRWLMRRLDQLHLDADPVISDLAQHVMLSDPVPQPSAPSALYLSCPDDEILDALCTRLGIEYEHRVSARLAAAIPSLDATLGAGRQPGPPPGFEPYRLTCERRTRWSEVDDDAAPGGYEYKGWGPSRFYFRSDDGIFQAEKWVVVYAELRRLGKQVLRHSAADDKLYVPGAYPLPLLAARTAVLRTGLAPRFFQQVKVAPDAGSVNEYRNIPRPLAETLADRLGQALIKV